MEVAQTCLGAELTFRICPRLETKGPNVIKGINLEGLRVVGEVSELAQQYYEQGADELIVTDVTSSWFSRESTVKLLTNLLGNCFIPITVGGGIRTLSDADSCLRAGAERVSINSAAFTSPELFPKIADKYGCQATVLNIQAKRVGGNFMCYFENGREPSGLSLQQLVEQSFLTSVGEIFLNSVDFDGTRRGIDLALIEQILNLTDKPIMYCGGVSSEQDILTLIDFGFNAVSISSALHYRSLNLSTLKQTLQMSQIDVRPLSL